MGRGEWGDGRAPETGRLGIAERTERNWVLSGYVIQDFDAS
jgi:hypothetical protein